MLKNSLGKTGYVGEVLSSIIDTEISWPAASGAWGDLTSKVIPAGAWLVSSVLHFSKYDATYSGGVIGRLYLGMSTTTGNNGANLSAGVNLVQFFNSGLSGGAYGIPMYLSVVVVSTGSNLTVSGKSLTGNTLYVKGYNDAFIAGGPRYSLKLEAIRIAM